jgi:hypothetical protein
VVCTAAAATVNSTCSIISISLCDSSACSTTTSNPLFGAPFTRPPHYTLLSLCRNDIYNACVFVPTDRIIVGTPIKADGTLFGGVQGPPAPWVINGLIVSCISYPYKLVLRNTLVLPTALGYAVLLGQSHCCLRHSAAAAVAV